MPRSRKRQRSRPCTQKNSTGGRCKNSTTNPNGDCGSHKRASLLGMSGSGGAGRPGRLPDDALQQIRSQGGAGGSGLGSSADDAVAMSPASRELQATVVELNDALARFDDVSQRLADASGSDDAEEWLIGRDWPYEADDANVVVIPDLGGLEPDVFADQIRRAAADRRRRGESVEDVRTWAYALVEVNTKCHKARDLPGPWPHSPSLINEYWQPLSSAASSI